MDTTATVRSKKARRGLAIKDLVALESEKARAQTITCLISTIVTGVLALATFAVGASLPCIVDVVTPITVWVSMAMEAAAIGLGAVSRWISRNALS
jgi:hypothetical protein